jgi:hypothetical protein
VLYGQELEDPHLRRVHLIIVRCHSDTLRCKEIIVSTANDLIRKFLSALVPILTSRQTRKAFGLTLQRPLAKDYQRLLNSVSSRIAAAKWKAPKNFDADDSVVVYWYSLDSIAGSPLNYRELNTLLRTRTHPYSADLWLLAAYLYEAVGKLPRRFRDSFRVAKTFTGFDSIYSPGNIITETAFVSSSRNPRISFPGDLYFSLRGLSGRLLAPLAEYDTEDEILFLPGIRFEVLDIEDLTDGSIHICLEEKL